MLSVLVCVAVVCIVAVFYAATVAAGLLVMLALWGVDDDEGGGP